MIQPPRTREQQPKTATLNFHPHWVEVNHHENLLYEQLVVAEREGDFRAIQDIKDQIRQVKAYNKTLWPD